MPRKPKVEKQIITVMVNGKPVKATLHPPTKSRTSWYVYWPGLVTSKSTGQRDLEKAIGVVESMIQNGGKQVVVANATLSDKEFEEVQRIHFQRKKDQAASIRASKSLDDLLDSINAFKEISGLDRIASATPDDCARFQQESLCRPKNWRSQYSTTTSTGECISPNTVLKWSRSLQAAFERVNRNAGKKCVRGVVPEDRLLVDNPWTKFTWIEGTEATKRQFDTEELLSLLDYLETEWKEMSVAPAAAKIFLWSGCRRQEVASLTWDSLRMIEGEVHFEIVGKWGVERWFRIPQPLFHELQTFQTSNRFVFAAYRDQLIKFHAKKANWLQKVKNDFDPRHFGRWFYHKIKSWAKSVSKEDVFVHIFRKTTFQHARRGEDINRQVAADARVSESVLMTNYVHETAEELRQKSNRTYARIVSSLPLEVRCRYGLPNNDNLSLEQKIRLAVEESNWPLVHKLSARLED